MSALEVRLTANAELAAGTSVKKHSGRTLSGYAAIFNSLSQDLGGFRERILPGAFRDTLRSREVLGLYSHNHESLLARTSTGSLKLSEDSRGLAFEMRLANTTLGRDIAELVSAGELSKMSFGFRVSTKGGDSWSYESGRSVRTLQKVDLFEISVVPEPAYLNTSVFLRAAVVVVDAVLAAALADRRRRLDSLML